MKTDVEELSPTRVRLSVEVPFDELKPSLDKAYREVGRQVRIPGFRPGRVPPPVIDRRVGRDVVLNQAVNDASSPVVFEAERGGLQMTQATGFTSRVVYFRLQFTNAVLSGRSLSGGDEEKQEPLSLTFQTVQLQYTEVQASGNLGATNLTATYDAKANTVS